MIFEPISDSTRVIMAIFVALVLAGCPGLAAQDASTSPQILKVGDVVVGEITEDSSVVHAPALDKGYTDAPVRGETYHLALDEPGPVTVELRSYFVDAYLVVRDRKGELLSEDDDGLVRTHARVVVEAGGPIEVEVFACALHGATGEFELSAVAGRPKRLSPVERAAAEIADARHELEVIRKAFGPDDLRTATSLDTLAGMLRSQGRFEAALPLYERALAIREQALGPAHPGTALSLNSVAAVLYEMGRYARARPLYERALAIWEKASGPESPEKATVLDNLATLLDVQGEPDEALPLYRRALAIRESALGKDHPDTAVSLNNLAAMFQTQGRYAEARPLLERALAIQEKRLGPDHPETTTSLNNLAVVLDCEGRYEEARPLFERSLAIRSRNFGPEHPDTANALHNLAALLRTQGKFDEARPLYERALAICEKTLGPDHPDTATSLNDLAALLRSQRKFDEARPLYERALAIDEKALGPQHQDTASTLDSLGLLLDDQGRHAEARPLLARALAIREKRSGPDHPGTAQSLDDLGRVLQAQGNYAEAQAHFERAFSIRERALGLQHPDTIRSLHDLSLLLQDRGETEPAALVEQRALAATQARFQAQCTRAPEEDVRRLAADVADALASELSACSPARCASDEIFADVTFARGAALRIADLRSRARSASEDPALEKLLDRLQSVTSRQSNLFSSSSIGDPEQFNRAVADLRKEREQLERDLAGAAASNPELKPVTAAELRAALPEEAALALFVEHSRYQPAQWKDGALARAGAWSEPRVSAWILRRGEAAPAYVDLGPSASIEKAITDYLEAVVGVRGAVAIATPVDAAARARRALELAWNPIAAHLGSSKRVIVAADGALATLPFGMIADESGAPLIEHYAFVQIEDASSLARPLHAAGRKPGAVTSPSATRAPSLLVAGAIDYENGGKLEAGLVARSELRGSFTFTWDPLSETRREADGVVARHRRRFGDAPNLLLLEDAPTEERLKAEMPKYDVIHLATHGYFLVDGLKSITDSLRVDEERARYDTSEQRLVVGYWPQFLCGVVCAGANHPQSGRDNGLLTGDEVKGLDLGHCDLVVLSACETALGKRQAGEGMLSLTRSFREAGARTVISSLWKVRDDSTKDLMLDFYDRLWSKSESKLDALRGAQLDMLRKNREKYGDTRPATWGAFVLTGAAE